ncbi:MAG: helix-turn-helix transcriptional regulator [Oscillospiraceae bacterium]|nr:helix-turn-helix transcriptional regulator [Oscillospiraceae bacterium]
MKNQMNALRQARHLTLQDVADALELPKNTYQQYEAGKRNMKPETMIKVADFFDVSVDELFQHRLPSRYVSLSADEKKIIMQYRALSPEEQRTIRIIFTKFSASGEIRKQDGGLRMASRTTSTASLDTESFFPPEDDETSDMPDNF